MFRSLLPDRRRSSHLFCLAILLGGAFLFNSAFAQDDVASSGSSIAQSQPAAALLSPQERYGPWVLLPPIVTIVLAIVFRQVIPAVSIGTLIAEYMRVPWLPAEGALGGGVIGGFRLAVETYLIDAIADTNHVKIIVFSMLIGGMVGIVGANGGTRAIVNFVSRWASTRERGQLATWAAGMVVFFDDYANAMIVGPSMRPVTDRLKISRAKLAYIVDSTAAPVASIAPFGTWIGAEIGFIAEGLDAIADRPAFLTGMQPYTAFLGSLAFRFYAILALVMVVIIGLLGRDFGPMRKAEQAAAEGSAGDVSNSNGTQPDVPVGRVWYALVPILTLVGATVAVLFGTGLAVVNTMDPIPTFGEWLREILSKGESYDSILYGALAAILVAAAIALGTRNLTLAKTVDSATDVMSRMLPTFIVLVLAWTLSSAVQALQLAEVSQALLESGGFQPVWLPALIFICAAVVSFATGTSWGTMGILCPATVQIAAGMFDSPDIAEPLPLFYASVGAVLSGAIFGDHCSPISDTTVLSSLASECSLEQHVWTQMPYALVVAIVALLCGDTLCNRFGQPWWVGMLAGAAALVLIVFIFGRKPRVTEPAPA